MELRVRQGVFPQEHLFLPPIHPLFSWDDKKWVHFYRKKCFYKIWFCPNHATSGILSLVDVQGGCPVTCARFCTNQAWGQTPALTLLTQSKFLRVLGPRLCHPTHSQQILTDACLTLFNFDLVLSSIGCWGCTWEVGKEGERGPVPTALILIAKHDPACCLY